MHFLVTFKNNDDDDDKKSEKQPETTTEKPLWYKLEYGKIIPCYDMQDYNKWFSDINNRRIKYTTISKFTISTVFLGLDHNFGYGPPVLFETLVNDTENNYDWMWRYRTLKEAKAGHKKVVSAAKKGEDLDKLDVGEEA